MSDVSADAPTDAPTPLCPQCGYDLRGLASPRCSECGLDLTTIGPAVSTIPWSNRHQIGRVRAYLATVRLFTLRSAWLKMEMARPVSIADARRFWLISVTLICLIPWILLARHGREMLLDLYDEAASSSVFVTFGATPSTIPQWFSLNILFPWLTGIALPGVAFVLLWLTMAAVTGVHTYLFHQSGLLRAQANRATALGHYLIAPILLPAAIFSLRALQVSVYGSATKADRWLNALGEPLKFVPPAFVLAIFVASLVNLLVRWLIALSLTTRCGWLYQIFAVIALPAMQLLCVLMIAVAVPWLIGVGWLSIRAMF